LSANINPVRSIKRKLIPKRKNKDEKLEELVEYYMDENLNGTFEFIEIKLCNK